MKLWLEGSIAPKVKWPAIRIETVVDVCSSLCTVSRSLIDHYLLLYLMLDSIQSSHLVYFYLQLPHNSYKVFLVYPA